MLGLTRMAELTAESMVQALLVPTPTFMQLVTAVPGIKTRAWQATAAQLAAQHHHILGRHKQLAPLNMFFRWDSSSGFSVSCFQCQLVCLAAWHSGLSSSCSGYDGMPS